MWKKLFNQSIIQFSSRLSPEVGLGHVAVLWTPTGIKHATFAAIIGQCLKCKYQGEKTFSFQEPADLLEVITEMTLEC